MPGMAFANLFGMSYIVKMRSVLMVSLVLLLSSCQKKDIIIDEGLSSGTDTTISNVSYGDDLLQKMDDLCC